jgi:2-(3-amino-3-carboxypropyl)histidine synthase
MGLMKLFHVLTKYTGDIALPDELLGKLPEKILLAGTIQFRDQMQGVVQQLKDARKEVILFRGVHDEKEGQMLGCDIFTVGQKVDVFLYVGDGLFHPTAWLYDNVQKVYYYNPFANEITELTQKDLEKVRKKRTISLTKFYASDHIGILVSTKPGQNNMKGAMELKKRLAEKGKKGYVFVSETLDMNNLENFPFVECWVNTACPRIIEDTPKAMINLWDLKDDIMKGFGVKVV